MPYVVRFPSGSYLRGKGWFSDRTSDLNDARLFNRRGPASSAIGVVRRRNKLAADDIPVVVEVEINLKETP